MREAPDMRTTAQLANADDAMSLTAALLEGASGFHVQAQDRARGGCVLPEDCSPYLGRPFTADELVFWRRRTQQRGDDIRNEMRESRRTYLIKLAAL